MVSSASASWGTVIFSLVVAYVLAIVPLPEWLVHWRPAWVALVVIYWVIAQPHRFGVVAAWFTGLMLDVLVNNTLGHNALALAVIAYTTYVLHMRIRVFPLWQQCLSVLVLVGIYMLVKLMIMRAVYTGVSTPMYWVPALVSALMWPWVVLLLDLVNGRRR
jgi:rod shape-determining protein MreD